MTQLGLDLFPGAIDPVAVPIPFPKPPAASPPPKTTPDHKSAEAARARDAAAARSRDADELLKRLLALGLKGIARCRLTNNARTMLSYRAMTLRVHRGYVAAPDRVLAAMVALIQGRTRRERREARRIVLEFPIVVAPRTRRRRREPTHPRDVPLVAKLVAEHGRLNAERFGGLLAQVAIRVSRKMRTKLGHYAPAAGGAPAEIAISRRHIRRHSWDDVLETLLHEMVHQWQSESGMSLDHGAVFRRKARAVGAVPKATRRIA